eukprot:m.12559 g.12559  ORF g.12559 m.12559 type:complete len:94 (+) comp9978_c0_seq2:190-471(+)
MSCFDQVKGGFVLGGALGLGAGGVYGSAACLMQGYRGRKLLRGTAMQMLTFGATFGFFLAVGTGIRCEEAVSAPVVADKRLSNALAASVTYSI